jgi:hypothetical protein
VGNDLLVPDSKRERGVHARYALLGTRSAGGGRRPGDRLRAVPIGPPLALAASRGPGFGPSPARKWRARGRIEHTLLDGEFSVRPNRPKTFARNPTIPQEVPNVSIYDKRAGIPIKIPAWLVPRSGRDGGGEVPAGLWTS